MQVKCAKLLKLRINELSLKLHINYSIYQEYSSDMSSSENLKNARTYTKSHFSRIRNNLIKAVDENASKRTVEILYNQLKGVWLHHKHEAYLISLTEAEDDDWIGRAIYEFEETPCVVDIF